MVRECLVELCCGMHYEKFFIDFNFGFDVLGDFWILVGMVRFVDYFEWFLFGVLGCFLGFYLLIFRCFD